MSRFCSTLLGLMVLTVAGTLQATTVNGIEIQADRNPKGTFEVSCGEGSTCQGFLQNSPLSLSSQFATAWGGVSPGRDGQLQAEFLDRLLTRLGLEPVGGNYAKYDVAVSRFETNREYFWVKKGQWTAFFRNASSGSVTVQLDTKISHYGVAGAVVPIPPAFLLFGSALVGVGWLARRQRMRTGGGNGAGAVGTELSRPR